jgi:hypothetical protein
MKTLLTRDEIKDYLKEGEEAYFVRRILGKQYLVRKATKQQIGGIPKHIFKWFNLQFDHRTPAGMAIYQFRSLNSTTINKNKMELLIKVTDIEHSTEHPHDAIPALKELSTVLEESEKNIKVLLLKDRKKIDLVGQGCNIEISIK